MEYTIIDVREPDEFADEHVRNAINIPLSRIMDAEELKRIPKAADIVVYCRSGSRSGIAKEVLQRMGYAKVVNGINKETVDATYS